MKPNVTITLTRYNEANELIHPCIEGLAQQKNVRATVYFLDQTFDAATKKLCANLSTKNITIHYKKISDKSLSNARNIGIKLAKTDLVLFIDSDAIPEPNWAYELANTYRANPKAAIVGGKSVAKWLCKPKWYHKSNILMDMYSTIDLGATTLETSRIVGVNFSLNKKLLKQEAFFDENLGRRPGSLMSGEESDLCARSEKKGFTTYYTGKATVHHQIQTDRMRLAWVFRRYWYAGKERAMVGGTPQTYTNKRNMYDRLLLPLVAIPYVFGFISNKLNHGTKK